MKTRRYEAVQAAKVASTRVAMLLFASVPAAPAMAQSAPTQQTSTQATTKQAVPVQTAPAHRARGRLVPTPVSAAQAVSLPDGQSDATTQTLLMTVKEQRPLPEAAGLSRIAIADPGVVDVMNVRDGFLLVAKKSGTTVVSLWHRNQPDPQRLTVNVQSELAASVLNSAGPLVTVHGQTAVISGDAPSVMAHQQALDVAKDSAKQIVDTSDVAPGGVVQVDVKVVEFSKTVLKEVGFNLATSRSGFGFGLFSPSSLTNVSATTNLTTTSNIPLSSAFNLVAGPLSGMTATLSLMQSNGLARVLAEPSLVALSGQTASFLAGGEIPVPQAGGLGTTTIEYKSFGIGLSVTPTVLSPKRIALKVAPEASDLDYGNALTINGATIPAITTRRADTTVELGDGESFVISGLVSRSTATSVSKVPLLGDLPIIGAFFRSLNYQQNDKELVIIVTPHLVQPIAKGVALPLPGQEEQRDGNVWGNYVMGAASPSQLPGFSR